MPDDLSTPPPAESATDPTPPPAPPPAPPSEPDPLAQLGDPGKKALQEERRRVRELEDQVKILAPLAESARKAEDAKKSAEQKLTEKLTAATAEADSARTEAMRLRAALSKMPAGFDPAGLDEVVLRLRGTTPDELAADAEKLFALFGAAQTPTPQAPGQRTPVEQLRPGAMPTGTAPSLADQIAAAEAAKDWRTSMALKSQATQAMREQINQ